ncbi:MAG: ABC transporter permease subunit [Candidatus Cloacimonetes bacterium]|nr:ABC transporter permease subunit [Candidatus Cloacimonadota bacterium]
MPIIGKVGRKSFKLRSLNITIHLLLLIGALTMIYPFMVMVSSSFKSNVDAKEFSVIPQYFFDDEMLYRKFIESRMNEESNLLIQQYKNRSQGFEFLKFPQNYSNNIFSDWQEFLEENKDEHTAFDYHNSEQFGRGVYPRNERIFRNLMKEENGNDLKKFNYRFGTSVLTWDEVRLEEREILNRNFSENLSGFLGRYNEYRKTLPTQDRVYASLDGHFISNELNPVYRGKLEEMNKTLGTNYSSWNNVILSQKIPDGPMQKHWTNYIKNILNIQHIRVNALAEALYVNFLEDKYEDISLLNSTYKTNFLNFSDIELLQDIPTSGAILVDWAFFIENIVPAKFLYVKSVEFDYRNWLKEKYKYINNLNENYSKGYSDFSELTLTENIPEYNLKLKNDWLIFVRDYSDNSSKGLLMTSQKEFLDHMRKKFPDKNGNLNLYEFNRKYGTDFKLELNVYPAKKIPEDIEYKKDWLNFVQNEVSGKFLIIDAEVANSNWQNFLTDKYSSIEQLNKEYSLIYNNFESIGIDHIAFDHSVFVEHQKRIFWEFTKRNYIMVLDVMLYNGRAIVNTLIYCLLAIITALIVNPLAAYAMSRFKLKASYKIILILMLTMAFPPMVMGIPNFLLLKKFNMLNTFFALILPAAADGYFIFLLKGFFDSLPQELFESATIDGAGEVRIFWKIAMNLSKPIMAVIALGAFNAAYRNFMFAFIVCQDQDMWTMMVHIYQLMQRSCAGVGFAALVIAAIPTFAVFVFFQNIIIKGIVVPTEK